MTLKQMTDELASLREALPMSADPNPWHDTHAVLTHALAALYAVAKVRALVTAATEDASPLIDREAIRRALDGEGA